MSKEYNYIELLGKWQSSIRLVGSLDELCQHVQDARFLLEHIPTDSRVVDVGSGAGLPGIVIAIDRPDVRVTALEPINKKHAFLRAAKRELELDNFDALAERDEQHRSRPDFEPYDVAVSRATFAVPEWLTRAGDLIRLGGRVLAHEGETQHALPDNATRHPYRLGTKQRSIIVLQT